MLVHGCVGVFVLVSAVKRSFRGDDLVFARLQRSNYSEVVCASRWGKVSKFQYKIQINVFVLNLLE